MKIGFCGTLSVGKSTLVNELAKLDCFKNYEISVERSKYLRDLGIKLNTDSTLMGQLIFAAERSIELMKENIISDRSIYDVCAFTLSSKSIGWNEKIDFTELLMTLRDNYDAIIYVSPEGVEIEDNGVREIDPEYRNKIDIVIREMLSKYAPKKLIKVKGTTEERIQKILSELSFRYLLV